MCRGRRRSAEFCKWGNRILVAGMSVAIRLDWGGRSSAAAVLQALACNTMAFLPGGFYIRDDCRGKGLYSYLLRRMSNELRVRTVAATRRRPERISPRSGG